MTLPVFSTGSGAAGSGLGFGLVFGLGFGLGFGFREVPRASGLASEGAYGWGGAYGATYLVDPRERLVIVFMIQQLPNRSDVAAKFPTLVYQALVEPAR